MVALPVYHLLATAFYPNAKRQPDGSYASLTREQYENMPTDELGACSTSVYAGPRAAQRTEASASGGRGSSLQTEDIVRTEVRVT